jgi:hypothetical protein
MSRATPEAAPSPGTIAVYWTDGMPSTGADADASRAETAAHESLERDGFTPFAAATAYVSDSESPGGLAWQRAADAADHAATLGWHNPDGGHVEIECPEAVLS